MFGVLLLRVQTKNFELTFIYNKYYNKKRSYFCFCGEGGVDQQLTV